jgi:hypothetical protein
VSLLQRQSNPFQTFDSDFRFFGEIFQLSKKRSFLQGNSFRFTDHQNLLREINFTNPKRSTLPLLRAIRQCVQHLSPYDAPEIRWSLNCIPKRTRDLEQVKEFRIFLFAPSTICIDEQIETQDFHVQSFGRKIAPRFPSLFHRDIFFRNAESIICFPARAMTSFEAANSCNSEMRTSKNTALCKKNNLDNEIQSFEVASRTPIQPKVPM